MNKKVLTEQDVRSLPPGSPCYVERGTILTPLARELALARQNAIVECDAGEDLERMKSYDRRIALGSDHDGEVLAKQLKSFLQDSQYWIIDCRGEGPEALNYLDVVAQIAGHIREGKAHWGIMIDRSGTSSGIAANKFPGIRAAHCYDRLSAKLCREHTDCNVLTLNGLVTNFELASLILTTWLNTPFDKKDHRGQVCRIEEIEQRFLQCCVVAVSGDPYCAL